ncbi:MAG: thioredoxin [Lachnospiraceae bacterium]|nr:thioredoxin [Lachnospiraceae bacterium]MBQ9607607.1 thioredoxin [Lachnospiraceae bacterium]MBR1522997.1 thioredoxin [Lachnospiraceae bacterium]
MVNVVNSDKWTDVAAQDIAVVDFNATWCGPCKMMAPVLEELSGEYEGKVGFYAIDVDENPDLAEKFSVMSIPNLVLLKKGELADTSVGFKPKEALKSWIDSQL